VEKKWLAFFYFLSTKLYRKSIWNFFFYNLSNPFNFNPLSL